MVMLQPLAICIPRNKLHVPSTIGMRTLASAGAPGARLVDLHDR